MSDLRFGFRISKREGSEEMFKEVQLVSKAMGISMSKLTRIATKVGLSHIDEIREELK